MTIDIIDCLSARNPADWPIVLNMIDDVERKERVREIALGLLSEFFEKATFGEFLHLGEIFKMIATSLGVTEDYIFELAPPEYGLFVRMVVL